MRATLPRFLTVVLLTACGASKTPSSGPLAATHLQLALADGSKPAPLTGRAFAIVAAGRAGHDELVIHVFDERAGETSCTDINVGGWMDRLGQGHAAIVNVADFPQRPGKYAVTSVSHVRSGRGRQLDMRSAPGGGARIEVRRWDQLFEATISGPGTATGTVSGIVCAGK